MKTLYLHPYTTINAFNTQLEQLIGCRAIVYSRLQDELQPFHTLSEAGFGIPGMMNYEIDETVHVREFESGFLTRFNIALELCTKEMRPLTDKSIRIFQLKTSLPGHQHFHHDH